MDCCTAEHAKKEVKQCEGCNGGNPAAIMNYLKSHDTCLNRDYRFIDGLTPCRDCRPSGLSRVRQCAKVGETYKRMEMAIYEHGPVAAIVNFPDELDNYQGGVWSGDCSTKERDMNHVVLVVGWDVIDTVPVWIALNNWGTGWGDDGYIYYSRRGPDKDGICGMLLNAYYVPLFWDGPHMCNRESE